MRRAIAFCPGHVTGFFQVLEHDNVLASGSRGAGFCTSLGARSEVWMTDGEGEIDISINGIKIFAPVTEHALRHILGREPYDLNVMTTLQLPMSQGFGTSAAGVLSASLALTSLLDLPRNEAFEAAHESEIFNRAGMGDVSALFRAGMTFRRKEGLPPLGKVDRIDGQPEIVLCSIGNPLRTADVLKDEKVKAKINSCGKQCIAEFENDVTVDSFMRISKRFTMDIGMASPDVLRAMRAVEGSGVASMSMLGNSVFAIGETDVLLKVLSAFGTVFKVSVDMEGVRLVDR